MLDYHVDEFDLRPIASENRYLAKALVGAGSQHRLQLIQPVRDLLLQRL